MAATLIAIMVLGTALTAVILIVAAIVVDRHHRPPEPGTWKPGEQARRRVYRTSEEASPILWSTGWETARLCEHDPMPIGEGGYRCPRCGAVGKVRVVSAGGV